MVERSESQGFFEMLWDCDHCDTKGLLGKSQRHCANCGAPQNPDKRYFPKEGEATRIDGHHFVGTDRVCPSCSTPQSSAGTNCTHCGAPLDGSKLVNKVVAPAPARVQRPWIKWVIVAVVLLIGGLVYYSCRTKDAKVRVTGHRWERAVAVERFVEESEQKFEEDVPADASDVRCRTAPHPTRTVVDPANCQNRNVDKGDGTFEVIRECADKPADGSLCSYLVRRWKPMAPIRTTGTDLNPIDPRPEELPPADAPALLDATRRRGATATYTLVFGEQSCDVSEPVWRKYADGQELTLKVRAASGKIVCSDVQ